MNPPHVAHDNVGLFPIGFASFGDADIFAVGENEALGKRNLDFFQQKFADVEYFGR